MWPRGISFSLKLLGGCCLVGPAGLVTGRSAQRRRLACLAAVAAAGRSGITRDRLLALLWPESNDGRARGSLRDTLYVLRSALGEDALLVAGDRIALNTEAVACDVTAFDDALERCDPAGAVAVYEGPFLDGFHISDAPEFERWVDGERMRLEEAYAGALQFLAQQAEGESDAVLALEWWRRLATLRPYDGGVAHRLVDALEAAGDRAGAIVHVHVHAALLRSDLEMEPDPALLERIEQLRSGPPRHHGDGKTASDTRAEPAVRIEPSLPTVATDGLAAKLASGFTETANTSAHRRRLVVLAALGLIAVMAAIPSYHWLRSRGPAPSGEGVNPTDGAAGVTGERILVADFAEIASDTLLGDAVSQALRLGLARSTVLRVVGQPGVTEALQRMRRAPDTPLHPDVAREVAIRNGIKGVIQGEVREAGGYLITAALEVAASGDRIQAWNVTARDSSEILAAIEDLVELIRRDAGESLAAIEAGDPAWTLAYTTSSLPAMRKQVEGLRAFWRGEYLRAADLQEEAIALDPDFANAHLILATTLASAGPISRRALKAWARAYELRDQLSPAERYAVVANHALYVRGNLPAAIDAYRSHVEARRRTGEGGWYASFGEALMAAGHFAEAEQVLQEARQAWPTPLNQLALASALVRSGKPAEAESVIAEALARFPGQSSLVLARARLAAASGDYAAAHAVADIVYGSPSGRVAALFAQIDFDAPRGRLREAIDHLRELEREQRVRGLADEALRAAVAIAMLRLRLGEGAAAAAEMDSVLAAGPMSDTDPISYPYFRLAHFFAAAGQPARAEALIGGYLRAVPTELQRPDLRDLHRTRAAVRLAQGRPQDALAELEEAAAHPRLRARLFDGGSPWSHYVPIDASPELARVYNELGMRDSAVAVYERYLAVPDLFRTRIDALELGDALMRLAELREAAGDVQDASRVRRRLAELWTNADPELRPAAR